MEYGGISVVSVSEQKTSNLCEKTQ